MVSKQTTYIATVFFAFCFGKCRITFVAMCYTILYILNLSPFITFDFLKPSTIWLHDIHINICHAGWLWRCISLYCSFGIHLKFSKTVWSSNLASTLAFSCIKTYFQYRKDLHDLLKIVCDLFLLLKKKYVTFWI